MKLQIDQIESFDSWLSQTEERISTKLDTMEEDLSGIDRQYQQLAKLQDELVSQQQITESLQNMVIVIDDSSTTDQDTGSKYSSTEIEHKLLSLSERWAQICNFVQNRWIQLQEIKVELEQIELNRTKVDQWLTEKEDEMEKMKSEIDDTNLLMQHVHSIQKTETEMDDIRQSILTLDNSLKILGTHYDSTTSNELKALNEQINNFEKRWRNLIDNLEQCSSRLKKSHLNHVETNIKQPDNNLIQKTITTTTIEETTTTTTINDPDDSINKKRKLDNINMIKSEFDVSARKYIDWIDNIERILDETI
jgi:predicted  nucleic acid-binding Zn-ribbon protein